MLSFFTSQDLARSDGRTPIVDQLNEAGGVYYSDQAARLLVRSGEVEMHVVNSSGPTNLAAELRKVRAALSAGDAVYQPPFDEHNYGLQLRFTRSEDTVFLDRVEESKSGGPPLAEIENGHPLNNPMPGPPRITTSWSDLVAAIDAYVHWHLTEHLVEAPWLRKVDLVKQWLAETDGT